MAINLGIDCCSKWTSVGLSAAGQILSEIHLNISRRQAACLPEAVDRLLSFSGHHLGQVDRIVLNTGPGSFTGLRVGLSYGLALAASLDRPVVPVNSLECIALDAFPLFHEKTLAPVLWAKRGYVYGAVFRKRTGENRLSAIVEPSFFSHVDFLETISREEVHALLILEKERQYDLFSHFPSILSKNTPSGGGLALLGELYFERAVSFQKVKGLYLRPPDIG